MKCLTICQPWAHAIMHWGKDVENRGWATKHRGEMLIHAGKTKTAYDEQDPDDWKECGFTIPKWDAMPRGLIIGVVELVDCIPSDPGLPYYVPGHGPNVWADGKFLWLLRNPRLLKEPIPYRGLLFLFDVPDELLKGKL